MTWLDSAAWLVRAVTPDMPQIAAQYVWLESLRVVGLVCGLGLGFALMAAPWWNR